MKKILKSRIRLSYFFAIAMLVLIGVSTSIWENQHSFVATVLFATGLMLVGVGSFGRLWCSLYIAGYKDKQLIVEGPYSISRNPLYFFSLLGVFGVGLCTETLTLPAICIVVFILYYPAVIRREEEKLRKVHGTLFNAYVAATPRFFPNLSKLKEPASYLVNTQTFRSHIFQALWFVWVVCLLEVFEELHHLGWLPELLRVY